MRISNSKFTATEKALNAVILASKRRLTVNQIAFFRTALDYLETVFTEAVGTMATNGKQLLIAPSFVEKLMEMKMAEQHVDGVIVHETKHCTDLHHIRMRGFDPKLFNIAGDMSINFYVKRIRGLALPEGCVEGAYGQFLDRKNNYEPFAVERLCRMIQQESEECGMTPEELFGDPELTGRVEEYVIQIPSSEIQKPDQLENAETDDTDTLGSCDDESEDSEESEESNEDGDARINPIPTDLEGEGSSGNKSSGDEDGEGKGKGKGKGESEGEGEGESGDGGESVGGEMPDTSQSDKTGWEPTDRGRNNTPKTRQPTLSEIAEETQRWVTANEIASKAQKSQGEGRGRSTGFHYGRRKCDVPPVDFRALLEKFVADVMENERTFRRVSRRHMAHDLIMPTDCDDNIGPVIIMQDVSGSVGHQETLRFFDCIKDILAKWDITATLIQFDHQVQLVEEIRSSDASAYEFKRAGSGGTDFDAPFNYVKDHIIAEMSVPPSCAIVLTDMEASFPHDEPEFPVMWCSSNSRWNSNPPFGEVVHVM